MKKIFVIIALLELLYLFLSLYFAELFGQWSYEGEIARTFLRIISIASFYFFYRSFINKNDFAFNRRKLFYPPFLAAAFLFILFALLFTNAEHETFVWQYVFAISGILAGFREELFYRGIVQRTLETKFHYRTALLLSCSLFTLSHVQYIYYKQPFPLLLVFLAGIIFGCIFIHTGSVFIAGLVHGLYDAFLCIKVTPLRLSPDAGLMMLLLVTLLFLLIISRKSYATNTGNTGSDSQGTFSPQ